MRVEAPFFWGGSLGTWDNIEIPQILRIPQLYTWLTSTQQEPPPSLKEPEYKVSYEPWSKLLYTA